jgi:hypothetical protein
MTRQARTERDHDKALEDSFPASDPPGNSGITGPGAPNKRAHKGSVDEHPTGTPTSDRYATETAHHREDAKTPGAKR